MCILVKKADKTSNNICVGSKLGGKCTLVKAIDNTNTGMADADAALADCKTKAATTAGMIIFYYTALRNTNVPTAKMLYFRDRSEFMTWGEGSFSRGGIHFRTDN